MSQLTQCCPQTTTDELVDIREVTVDKDLPKEERIAAFLHQIKNPYRFRCGDFVVNAAFASNGVTLEECLQGILRGYEVGAVDYITKPFVIGALQRKIKAMFAMLEHHKPAKDIYDDGRLFLDFSEQAATLNGKPLALSPMEYKMLNLFRKNPKQVLTRQQLLEKLWDAEERFVDEHTLTTSISRIRSKIETDGGAPYIKTIYGMGYQWMGGEAK